jgi:histidine triad (HIT) family protein
MAAAAPPHYCVFCAIVAGKHPAPVVYEDSATVAFLDITAVTPGHSLIVPKTHASDLWEITPEDWAAVAWAAHRVAQHLRAKLNPDGITLFQANGAAGWQDVFHLHVHVVPRTEGDNLHRPWVASPVPLEMLEGLRRRLDMRHPPRHRAAEPGAPAAPAGSAPVAQPRRPLLRDGSSTVP